MLTGGTVSFVALAVLRGPAALLGGVGPGFVGPRTQPLGVIWRPMIGDLLQNIGDLFLGGRDGGGKIGRPTAELVGLFSNAGTIFVVSGIRHKGRATPKRGINAGDLSF